MKGDLKMRTRFVGAVVVTLALACWLGPAVATAQTPGEADGTWDPPRTPDGQPDIRGSWGGGGASVYSLEEPLAERGFVAAEDMQLTYQSKFCTPMRLYRKYAPGSTTTSPRTRRPTAPV